MSGNNDSDREGKSTRSRRSKACKHCHALKVRCIPVDENDPSSPCVRCVNAGRTCEIDNSEQRKRRKRSPRAQSDSLVADLQDEIQTLKEQLEALRQSQPSQFSASSQHSNPSFTPQTASDASSPPFMTKTDLIKELGLLGGEMVSLKALSDQIRACSDLRSEIFHREKPVDVVSCNIITKEMAEIRLQKYKTVLYKAHPLVEIPDNITVDEMIKSQPFLFNSIMCITSHITQNEDVKIYFELERHAMSSVIYEVMVCGSKNLQLIKSLAVLSVWYSTPEFFRSRRYHILNSVAVTILRDLGFGAKSSLEVESREDAMGPSETVSDIEYRHIVLSLYLSTVGFCLILRRTIYVNWTVYVEECCEVLERHGDPRYKTLVTLARLTHELERIHHLFHAPDAERNRGIASTFNIQEILTKLYALKKKCRKDDHLFLCYFHSVEAYLHQPFPDDLKISPNNGPHDLSPKVIRRLTKCTSSCVQSMNEFSSLTDEEIAALPLAQLFRIVYTAGILIRLRYFILSLPSNIERDLVPASAIIAVMTVNKRMSAMSESYPNHFSAQKMKLILRIFIETYYSQVSQLLLKDDDGSHKNSFTRMNKNEYKELARLANVLIHQPNGDAAASTHGPGLHLDLLSYVATEHRKNSNVGQEDHPSPGGMDPNSQAPPPLVPRAGEPVSRLDVPRNNFGGMPTPFNPMAKGPVPFRQAPFPMPIKPLEPNSVRNDYDTRSPVPDYRRDSFVGVLNPDLQDFTKESINEFDDEFWANLLSTGEDSYQFAPNVPTENPLFGVFN